MAESQNPSSTKLPFPPVTRSHILHCSYHHWRPKYRSITPKARLIPLTAPFLAYLRSDGIILPPDPPASAADLSSTDTDSGIFSSNSTSDTSDAEDSDAEDPDPSTQWPEIHAKITSTIAELGGNIIPKLNWSAPKDATWINATNSMECKSANDSKSSTTANPSPITMITPTKIHPTTQKSPTTSSSAKPSPLSSPRSNSALSSATAPSSASANEI
ncbi:MAG: hypothetical protein Q9223_007140 [Gallowayella weberi]